MKKWRFISNQNSTIVGINDAGIETFTANMNKSLVREIIQNSLDAVLPNSKAPVVVEFSCFEIEKDKLPDLNTFVTAIKKCKESNQNEPDAFKFFQNAERILDQQKVRVLRISDHNTIGLDGADTCAKGTSWSRLVKENGSSNKEQSSGGSFGIGKSAAFACSDLRTVFYSSMDSKGFVSNFGVAKLVSFEDEKLNGWTTGVGYYSEDEKFVAIPELATFDAAYFRVDSGTDIYVIGMHQTENFEKDFITAVLLNFLVSLVKGKLIVKIQDKVISQSTLVEYMSRLNPYDSEEIKDLLEYYHLLTASDPKILKISLDSNIYGKRFGFKDGECILYLKEGEGFNRKILVTRRAGMRILEQNRISGSIEFTGVLIVEGNNMNEAFKRMEIPSHDAWEPGRCRGEEKLYTNILSGLRKYLRDTVKECFGKITSTSMDALGASDFLPDKPDEEQEEKIQKDDMSTRIKDLSGRTIEPKKNRSKAVEIEEVKPCDDNGGSGLGGESEVDSDPHPSPEPGPYPGSNPGFNPKPSGDNPGNERGYREISVKKRLICKDARKGIYNISMITPSDASKGKLEFILSGEQNDFELPIVEAKIISGGTAQIDSILNNIIILNNLEKGKQLKLEVHVKFDGYCMMEVDYYANKK